MNLFERLQRRDPPPPPAIDREALREEMKRTDPDFARVSLVQHDALNAIDASQKAHQLGDRFNERLRDSWRPTP